MVAYDYYWQDGQARVVARLATSVLGYTNTGGPAVNCYPTTASLDRRIVILPISGRDENPNGFDVYEIERDHPEMHNPTRAQGEPVLSGGVPAVYDGRHCSELGAHYYPVVGDMTVSDGSGALTTDSQYQWQFVYEWMDARGVRHQSAPSAIYEASLSDPEDTVTFEISTLQLTEREDPESVGWPVEIVGYRTKAGGSTFYRETGNGAVARIDNDKNEAWITYVSGLADSALDGKEILYTDGGVFANFQPPALRHVIQHDRRLWGISRDNPRQIWISKILQPGYEMPGFHPSLVLQAETDHVALASLGTQLLALCEDGVYVYAGSPQDDTNQGNNLSGPHPVVLHTGCTNPLSVVQVPDGVAFQSRDSFWLVDKGLQATRVGGAVEDTIAAYPFCRSAVLDQSREVVLFSMTDSENALGDNPSAGVTLAWHYLTGEWTIWSFPSSSHAAKAPGRGGCVAWRGDMQRFEYHQSQADGTVMYLDNGWKDHDASIPSLKVSSAWLQFAGVAGFQRVQRVHLRGTHLGPHSLSIGLYYDFDTTVGDTIAWTEAEVAADLVGTEQHIGIHVPQQKGKAIRIEVTSTPGVAPVTGAQVRWETLAVQAGGKQGLFKLPEAGSK